MLKASSLLLLANEKNLVVEENAAPTCTSIKKVMTTISASWENLPNQNVIITSSLDEEVTTSKSARQQNLSTGTEKGSTKPLATKTQLMPVLGETLVKEKGVTSGISEQNVPLVMKNWSFWLSELKWNGGATQTCWPGSSFSTWSINHVFSKLKFFSVDVRKKFLIVNSGRPDLSYSGRSSTQVVGIGRVAYADNRLHCKVVAYCHPIMANRTPKRQWVKRFF